MAAGEPLEAADGQSLRTAWVRARYYGERAGEGGVIEVTPVSSEVISAPGR